MSTSRPGWLQRTLVFVGLALITGVLVATSLFNQRNVQPEPLELPSSMLFQLRNDDGIAVLSAVFGSRNNDWYVLPADLQVGDELLGDTANGLDIGYPQRQLQRLVGIKVDGSWRLDRLGLAALLDTVDGVSITPSRDVVIENADGGELRLRKGQSYRLNSQLASRYAVNCAPEDCASRFAQVWRALLDKLDAAWVPTILPSVGSSSRTNVPQADLVALIDRLQQRNHERPIPVKRLGSSLTAEGRALSSRAEQRLQAAGVMG